jgi:hypothetical protein
MWELSVREQFESDTRESSARGENMTTSMDERAPIEEPLAQLERQLIAAYVAGAGQDLAGLRSRHDDDARRLLAEASRYASEKLSEIEARSHYLHVLRGQE